jgi:isopentenyl-diphosphate delta-isomerase
MSSDPENLFQSTKQDDDPTAASRKQAHIELAFESQVPASELDDRFYYEPMLSAHPEAGSLPPIPFLGKTLRAPIWVSSMTGGTKMARTINYNLAQACAEFGMGMGLGSCRQLLSDHTFLKDFDVRPILGEDLPFFANLGIAQIENLIRNKETGKINDLIGLLKADGLIIHVNPLQEALQPEGDRFLKPPIETIATLMEGFEFPVIVKEVGQGIGPESLRALMKLPLAAIEFAAGGGTNFAKLELLRQESENQLLLAKMVTAGHSASEMLHFVRNLHSEPGSKYLVRQFILSGGVRDFLDGYYLLQKSPFPAVYGQASVFLKHAQGDYQTLQRFVATQIRGLELAHAFLKAR